MAIPGGPPESADFPSMGALLAQIPDARWLAEIRQRLHLWNGSAGNDRSISSSWKLRRGRGGQGRAKTSLGRSARPSLAFHTAACAGLPHASYSRTTRSAASERRGSLNGAGIFASRDLIPS